MRGVLATNAYRNGSRLQAHGVTGLCSSLKCTGCDDGSLFTQPQATQPQPLHFRFEHGAHRRPESMIEYSISSVTVSSLMAMSLPFLSTTVAVRPAGLTCTPEPYAEIST